MNILCSLPQSENEVEESPEPPPELSIDKAEEAVRQEHERLAAEYRNESALFMEALKNTTDDFSQTEETTTASEQETEFNGQTDKRVEEKITTNREEVESVPDSVPATIELPKRASESVGKTKSVISNVQAKNHALLLKAII